MFSVEWSMGSVSMFLDYLLFGITHVTSPITADATLEFAVYVYVCSKIILTIRGNMLFCPICNSERVNMVKPVFFFYKRPTQLLFLMASFCALHSDCMRYSLQFSEVRLVKQGNFHPRKGHEGPEEY